MNDIFDQGDESRWKSVLIELLFEKALCSSLEEAQAIVESIEEEQQEDNQDREYGDPIMKTKECYIAAQEMKEWKDALQDFLGISVEESQQIMDQCRAAISTSKRDGEKDDDASHKDSLLENPSDEDEDDVDGEYLGPGECELCERDMRLTRHHLIPKSTWPRMEAKLRHDWQAWCQQDSTPEAAGWMQQLIAQEFLDSARSSSKSDQQQELDSKTIRIMFKHHTCQICRPCHSAIHKFYDNMTLAQQYNTPELLLQDPQVYKFCQWASKQRVGKYK
jgi:hypothetical protein